jgi:hypothetical protein
MRSAVRFFRAPWLVVLLCAFVRSVDAGESPSPGTLLYVKEIAIGPPGRCPTCPQEIFAGDSIPVRIRGVFPDDCTGLVGVDLVSHPGVGPFPEPPILRITYGVDDCIERACIPASVPWETRLQLPPLTALPTRLRVETVLRRFQGDTPPDTSTIDEAQFPFAVTERSADVARGSPATIEKGSVARDHRCDDFLSTVACLHDSARCHLPRVDCDGNGGFGLDDVQCCAEAILDGSGPDTTHGRPDPSLSVRLGVPVEDAATIEVPVTLEGANPVGGARLVLRYPSERFEVAGVGLPNRSSWIELHQAAEGRAVVALLDRGGEASTSFHHSFTLRLVLRAGQQPGGEVAVETAEFADPGGVALRADLGVQTVHLGGGGLALGPGQPNPFGREVRFTITLARAGDLEVSVHDLTGRLVTTLHRGTAAAGEHTLRWDGRDANGSGAPDGIYFYRARAEGQTLARKVIMLREP